MGLLRHLVRIRHRRVAVVTGANRGIGLGITRALCHRFQGDVFLTARNADFGLAAAEELKKEGLNPIFHQLDITDVDSIDDLKGHLVQNYGGLDVLVNNAGIGLRPGTGIPLEEIVAKTLAVNYHGTASVCRMLCPVLRSHSRVVNLSTGYSLVTLVRMSPQDRERILRAKTISRIDQFLRNFEDLKAGTFHMGKWKCPGKVAYAYSKLGINALTAVHQRAFNRDVSRTDMVMNACCTGRVATRLTEYTGDRTVEEGIDTPVFLALLPRYEKVFRGEFVADRKITHWSSKW